MTNRRTSSRLSRAREAAVDSEGAKDKNSDDEVLLVSAAKSMREKLRRRDARSPQKRRASTLTRKRPRQPVSDEDVVEDSADDDIASGVDNDEMEADCDASDERSETSAQEQAAEKEAPRVESNKVYQWLGSAIKKMGSDVYYLAFKAFNFTFRVGDCVIVKPSAGENAPKWLAKIDSLWEDEKKVKWFEGRWYYRPQDTHVGRKKTHHRREIFETTHTDANQIRTIVGKFDIVTDVEDLTPAADVYLCRQFYNVLSKKFGPIRGWNPSVKRARLVYADHLDATISKLQKPQSSNDWEIAANQLQISAIPKKMPCRESERGQILQFVSKAIKTGSAGSSLYISGMPGLGKTATVYEIVRTLEARHAAGNLPSFQFVEINGMKLQDPKAVYTLIWESLHKRRVTATSAADLLDQKFRKEDLSRPFLVVLVDELDLIVTKRQSVLYNLFEWTGLPHSRLLVIGVANTMDLPERMLPRVHSRLGIRRVTFKPYDFRQIQTIIESRLHGLDVFKPDAIQLCARRVAAVSGDVRKALEICRRAVEIADAEDNGAKGEKRVGTSHINNAVGELYAQSHIRFVQTTSLYERILLIALILELRQTGVTEAVLANIRRRHSDLCRIQNHPIPSCEEVLEMCRRLVTSQLFLVDSENVTLRSIVRSSVQSEDIRFALQEDPLVQKLL